MERTGMIVRALILFAGVLGATAGVCPLNITGELDAYPGMYQRCFVDESHCCEGIADLIKSLQYSWMHNTRSFLLPDNKTAQSCVDEFSEQLIGRGIDSKLLATCRLGVDSFPSDSSSCNNITDFHSFEKTINVSALRQNCNAGGSGNFECRDCVRAMGKALYSLNQIPLEGKSKCPEFVLIYVGGGINCYDAVGPDAAFCILSVSNLSAVATGLGPLPQMQDRAADSAVNKTLIMTLVPSLAVLILILAAVFGYLRRLRSEKESQQRKLIRRYEILGESTGLIFFNMPEIKEATGNFSESNLIGEGSFGMVYRGTLADGRRIAVKRFKDLRQRAEEEFSHELLTGRRAFDPSANRLEHVLVSDWVVDMSQNGKSAEIIDGRIRQSCNKQSMEKVLLLALQCAHPRVGCRPSIGEALLILEGMESPSPNMVSALQSMEVDLVSSLNNRGDFTWLMSSDTAQGLFSSNSSSSSSFREFSV
ncbi:hypothetical protein SUGI_0262970 [Cryptomeria japonica]|nr:hypothetical protein SUGI_0262970 [Cryptomeria japonica]